MFKRKSQTEVAIDNVRAADMKVNEARAKSSSARSDLAAAEELYLTAPGEALLAKIVRLRIELDLTDRLVEWVSTQRAALVEAVGRAKVADLRAEAAEKRAEFERLRAKTRGALAELSKLEGVVFTGAILAAQPTPEMSAEFKRTVETLIPAEEIPLWRMTDGGSPFEPRSHAILEQAVKLEREAWEYERRPEYLTELGTRLLVEVKE